VAKTLELLAFWPSALVAREVTVPVVAARCRTTEAMNRQGITTMTNKKKDAVAGGNTLRIGTRVRCTDDGVTGRIVWANGVSVKIKRAEGEQVTWRRDSLATRPIDILAADAEHDTPAPTTPGASEPTAEVEQPASEAPAENTAPT
jgi:hypothetical protein